MRVVRSFFESLLKDLEENVDFLNLYLLVLYLYSGSFRGILEVILYKSTDLIFDDAF